VNNEHHAFFLLFSTLNSQLSTKLASHKEEESSREIEHTPKLSSNIHYLKDGVPTSFFSVSLTVYSALVEETDKSKSKKRDHQWPRHNAGHRIRLSWGEHTQQKQKKIFDFLHILSILDSIRKTILLQI